MTRERTPQEHRARHLSRHARRDQRWREQAARLIAAATISDASWNPTRPGFDVELVRAYCERLIAEADDLDHQREVFADWTRARGLGPENRERGAFVRTQEWCITITDISQPGHWTLAVDGRKSDVVWIEPIGNAARDVLYSWHASLLYQRKHTTIEGSCLLVFGKRVHVDAPCPVTITCVGEVGKRGGWPGNLARKYTAEQRKRRRCPRRDCAGDWLIGEPGDRVRVPCPECVRFKSTKTSRAFANGGNLRRAAQRLLDTLDGACPWNTEAEEQPSECTACKAPTPTAYTLASEYVVDDHGDWKHTGNYRCARCGGTGHNLRGVLPPLSEDAQRRLNHAPQRLPGRIEGVHFDVTIVDDLTAPTDEHRNRLWTWYADPNTLQSRDE